MLYDIYIGIRRRRAAAALRTLWPAWRLAVARWRQRRALAALDERLLRDIGVPSLEARAEARKGFFDP